MLTQFLRRLPMFLLETPGGAAGGGTGAPAPAAPAAAAPAAPAAPAPAVPAPAAPAAPEAPADQAVPYDRFRAVNDQLAETRSALEALQAKETAREREQLPELERARAEAADAQAAREAAELERDQIRIAGETTQREGWVREAARDAGFHNAEDAVLRVKTGDVKSQADAKKAVESLAKDESLKHLVKTPEEPKTGGDLLQQILNRGAAADGANGNEAVKPLLTEEQLNSMTTMQLVELQEKDADLYQRSMAAARAATS